MLIRRIALPAILLATLAVLTTGILSSAARADWTTLNGEGIATGPDYQYGHATQSDGTGGAWIAWRVNNGGGEVRLTRVRRDGSPAPGWELGGQPVRTDIPTTGFPSLVADGPDGASIAYLSYDDPSIVHDPPSFLFVQRFQGNGQVAPGWPEAGVQIAQTIDDRPRLVSDGRRGTFVLWSDRTGAVLAQHLDARGRKLWGDAPRTVYAGPAAFAATSDEQGGLLFAFEFAGFAAPPRALRIDGDGQVHPGWSPAGVEITRVPAGYVDVVADGHGGGLFSFTTGNDDPSHNSRDVYAQHVRADGSIDPAWDADGLPIATAPREQSSRIAVTDDAGGAILFWADHRPGTRGFDIWAQRVTADGRVLWTPGGNSIIGIAGNEVVTDIAPDGRGGAFFVWADIFSVEQDVFMSRIDATGAIAPGWTAEGLQLSDLPGNEVSASIAYRAPFDPIVVWDAMAIPGVSDVAAMRVSADGTSATPAAGAAHGIQKATTGSLAAASTAEAGVVARGTTLELSLPMSGPTRIDLFDLGGRRVASRDAGVLGSGRHTIDLGADPSIRSGLYFVQVSQAGHRWTSRLSLLR